jgi:hypothetical protein
MLWWPCRLTSGFDSTEETPHRCDMMIYTTKGGLVTCKHQSSTAWAQTQHGKDVDHVSRFLRYECLKPDVPRQYVALEGGGYRRVEAKKAKKARAKKAKAVDIDRDADNDNNEDEPIPCGPNSSRPGMPPRLKRKVPDVVENVAEPSQKRAKMVKATKQGTQSVSMGRSLLCIR